MVRVAPPRELVLASSLLVALLSACSQLGPEAAAGKAFERWATTQGLSYRYPIYHVESNDGTIALVRVTVDLRPALGVPWTEEEAIVQVTKNGPTWEGPATFLVRPSARAQATALAILGATATAVARSRDVTATVAGIARALPTAAPRAPPAPTSQPATMSALSQWTSVIVPADSGSIVETNQRMEMTAFPGPTYLGLQSSCYAVGDFDVRVDFQLLSWLSNNRHALRLAARDLPEGPVGLVGVLRASYLREVYQFRSVNAPIEGSAAANAGTLRLVRTGSTVTGYYREGSGFVRIGSAPTSTSPTRFNIELSMPNTDQFAGAVTSAYDNLAVSADNVSCAP